ncbi:uncharacterized protein EI97DRAFT_433081 [Westerdykella ornata]|uniref:F-box domain-containing protein n=1 Tax=Westerdykella ornata TaxID=318751 RepID=A0A6A6JK58_WESOR|nr:uncharacterized protein EI97DRAFT_433081 [Westerdykella ornata]KAF2276852.1 hypothetical protein EI97DRAFT_433081 [Westerdykella ornata]
MDELPTELIANICDHFDSPRELLAFRAVARRYRDIVESCTNVRLRLCRAYFPAFDDALLAIRLQRIPIDSRCHFSLSQNRYSFIPTQDYFQAVMEGRPVPPCDIHSCPLPPSAPWYEELEAVMDLYLLALAFHATAENGINHIIHGMPGIQCGITIHECMTEFAPQYIETYLRSFYRMCAFGSVFGQGLFAQPVINALEKMPPQEGEHSPDIWEDFQEETRQYPLYRQAYNNFGNDDFSWEYSERLLFKGFFDWLYSQPEPSNLDPSLPVHPPQVIPQRLFTDKERKVLALLQLWKVTYWSYERGKGETPDTEGYVKALFNDTLWPSGRLPKTIYRPTLKKSRWSEPLKIIRIINHWAEAKDMASTVVEPHSNTWVQRAVDTGMDYELFLCPWDTVLSVELKHRFRVKFIDRVDFMFRPDFGLLNPLDEVREIQGVS